MPDVDVKKLLDPTGPAVQDTVNGTRIAGRVAVTVYWEEIDNALRSGLSTAAIYRVLHKAGLVSVTLQAFTRQVKARREGARDLRVAAKPATGSQPLTALAAAHGPSGQEASASAGPDSEAAPGARPGIPRRPWRTGPREPPDPTKIFKPRDPLADD